MPAGRFATTRWTCVLAARDGTEGASRAALQTLCAAYWFPLYAFVRRSGFSPEDAADLTQSYFARFLEKGVLSEVRPQAGRFRSFLLATMRHFLANEWDRRRARKRAGDFDALSLDLAAAEGRFAAEALVERTPEREYERRWALVIVERALERLAVEARAAPLPERFESLKAFLLEDAERGDYSRTAQELAISEPALRVAVHRLRRRFAELLRAEIADTVVDPADTDAELRFLLAALRTS